MLLRNIFIRWKQYLAEFDYLHCSDIGTKFFVSIWVTTCVFLYYVSQVIYKLVIFLSVTTSLQ